MTVQWSTTLRNALLDQWETTIGVSAKLRIYSGSVPANAAAGIGASVMLAEFALVSDWAANASGGTKALNGLPLATTGDVAAGAGTAATYYRIWDNGATTCHEQGTVTATGGGGDMTIDNVSIANGQTVNITAFSKTAPGA